jgi:hypothetical protein
MANVWHARQAGGHWFEPNTAHSPIEIRPAAQAMMISIGSLSIPALVADAGGAGIGMADEFLLAVRQKTLGIGAPERGRRFLT